MLTPPTDSLYKFIAISGLIMTIWGVAYPWNKSYEYKINAIDIKNNTKMLENKSKNLQLLYDKLLEEEKHLNTFDKDYPIKLTAIINRKQQLYIELIEASLPIDKDLEKYAVMESAQKTFTVIGILSAIFGIILSIIGFWCWYIKVQKYQDQQIMKDE